MTLLDLSHGYMPLQSNAVIYLVFEYIANRDASVWRVSASTQIHCCLLMTPPIFQVS